MIVTKIGLLWSFDIFFVLSRNLYKNKLSSLPVGIFRDFINLREL